MGDSQYFFSPFNQSRVFLKIPLVPLDLNRQILIKPTSICCTREEETLKHACSGRLSAFRDLLFFSVCTDYGAYR